MTQLDAHPKRMIFHHPLPLPAESSSGSRVRPLRLLEAFCELGYRVTVVAGNSAERRAAMTAVRAQVAAGERFAFLYAEPPNAPLLWLNRQQPHRFQEYELWRWCRSQGIPVGLFYRDVHWRFAQYKAVTSWRKRAVTIPLYWVDWLSYHRWVDHLFLPSLGMAAHLPTRWPAARCSALPPGCTIATATVPKTTRDGEPLQLFYVGGIQPPLYDLKPMFAAIEGMTGVVLTVCCRAEEWAAVRDYYAPFDVTKIQIVHAHGDDLARYYRAADLFGLFWRPTPYLDFAMPVKVFEALGYGVPLVTTAGTETARFVASEGLGWVVATQEELRNLLIHVRDDRSVIAAQQQQLAAVQQRHSWQTRAQTVAELLTHYRKASAATYETRAGGRSAWATED